MKPRHPQTARLRPAEATDEETSHGPSASVRSLYDGAMARTARHDPRALQRYLSVLAAAPGPG